MSNCDLCNKQIFGGGKRYSPQQFKSMVKAGLRPPASMRILSAMLGMPADKEDAMWVTQVMTNNTDWILCDECTPEADRFAR
jgi:hypothetical protein